MAFVGEKITNEKDKEYVASKGFTYIVTGEPIERVRYWAVDRERDMMLISRGGGGAELPEGYALYMNGMIINMEGHERREGSRYDNTLKIFWSIDLIQVPEMWHESGCGADDLNEIIEEAFTAYACIGLKTSQVQEVIVEINGRL